MRFQVVDVTLRFWEKVQKSDGCWEWTAHRMKKGYGHFWVKDRMVAAHRHSWEMHNGPIPDGLCVLHECDNPPCVRPDHLFLGTLADNIADRDAKGRQVSLRGEAHTQAKLTSAQVREIRRCVADGQPKRALARRYGVTAVTIRRAVNGSNWRHVE